MAAFPSSIIPSTRTYSPGAFPHTAHGVYDGSQVRVRHSNTLLGVRLRLFFPAITTAELLSVISHYSGQRGRFLPFAIPDDLLSGVTTPADFTPAGHQWRYAARPTVEDISIVGGTNRHNLTIELETVPPENTIAHGARLRARASLQAGSAQLGEFFDVYAWLDAGAGAAADPFLVTATLDAGAASNVLTDPYFASVSLLLPMNGTNGSTTFSDASSNAFVGTANGNAQISTAQSKWGGSSGLLDGSGDYISIASNAAFNFGTGDFTVEAWVRLNSVSGDWFIASASGSGGLFFGYTNSQSPAGWGVGRAAVAWDCLSGVTATTATWYHIAVSRTGTSLRLFVDGTQAGSTFTNSQAYNLSATSLNIGSQGAALYLNGNMQDLRITKGVARYTANFTPPTAPFPTS